MLNILLAKSFLDAKDFISLVHSALELADDTHDALV